MSQDSRVLCMAKSRGMTHDKKALYTLFSDEEFESHSLLLLMNDHEKGVGKIIVNLSHCPGKTQEILYGIRLDLRHVCKNDHVYILYLNPPYVCIFPEQCLLPSLVE